MYAEGNYYDKQSITNGADNKLESKKSLYNHNNNNNNSYQYYGPIYSNGADRHLINATSNNPYQSYMSDNYNHYQSYNQDNLNSSIFTNTYNENTSPNINDYYNHNHNHHMQQPQPQLQPQPPSNPHLLNRNVEYYNHINYSPNNGNNHNYINDNFESLITPPNSIHNDSSGDNYSCYQQLFGIETSVQHVSPQYSSDYYQLN